MNCAASTLLDVESEKFLKKFQLVLDPQEFDSIYFHLCLQGLKNSSLEFNVAVSGLYIIKYFSSRHSLQTFVIGL